MDALDKLKMLSIVSAPHMKREQFSELYRSYEKASRSADDIIELTEEDNDYSQIKHLKSLMN